MSHLLLVTSIVEVDSLDVDQTTAYKLRDFIPISPFLLGTISNLISNSEGNLKQILVDVVQEIKSFNTTHA